MARIESRPKSFWRRIKRAGEGTWVRLLTLYALEGFDLLRCRSEKRLIFRSSVAFPKGRNHSIGVAVSVFVGFSNVPEC